METMLVRFHQLKLIKFSFGLELADLRKIRSKRVGNGLAELEASYTY